MALSLTYTLSNGTTADADQVMQNFNDVKNFINDNVIHKDGTVAMSSTLTLSGNPTTANHAVRKQYMDGAYVRATGGVADAYAAATWTTLQYATENYDYVNGAGNTSGSAFAHGTGLFTPPVTGVYLVSFTIIPDSDFTDEYAIRVLAGGVAFEGPKLTPNDANERASSTTPLHMSVPVYATTAQTIASQVWIRNGGSRTVGKDIAIAWLHA